MHTFRNSNKTHVTLMHKREKNRSKFVYNSVLKGLLVSFLGIVMVKNIMLMCEKSSLFTFIYSS